MPTKQSSKQISKDTRICVFMDTEDVLYTTVLVGDSGLQGVSRRIEKYLVKNLTDRGVKIEPSGAFGSGDAKLTVTLNTIETVATTSIGMWAPIAKQQPKIRYNATFVAGDGTTLFSIDDAQDDESIDVLTKKIAEKVGARVARCYK
jgi:hypothetical protein